MFTPKRRLLIAPNRTHATNVSKLERAKILRRRHSERSETATQQMKSARPSFKSLVLLSAKQQKKSRVRVPAYLIRELSFVVPRSGPSLCWRSCSTCDVFFESPRPRFPQCHPQFLLFF